MENSTVESAPPEPGGPELSVHALGEARLLPAVCPVCGAPGSRAQRVPLIGRQSAEELDAMYCDLCADHEQSKTTRRVALLSAMGLLLLSFVVAITLGFGSRAVAVQGLSTVLAAFVMTELLFRTPLWPRTATPLGLILEEGAENDGRLRLLVCRSRRFRRVLLDSGYPIVEGRGISGGAISSAHEVQNRVRLSVAGLGLGALFLIHSLGGATVRVVQSGQESAVLLVDSRHTGAVQPTNAEDPRAGRFVHVLGGRRTLQLVSATGKVLVDQTVTVWPGRTYIVGHLPPDLCLHWEKRTYRAETEDSIVLPVRGEGPVWELTDRVDSWFVPLGPRQAGSEPDAPPLEISGGTRRAVRLLPCRAPKR